MATSAARQTPPGARPNREARGACRPHHVAHMGLPGRSLELRGDAHPRGMTVQDRTRLNGRLFFSAGADAPLANREARARNGAPESDCAVEMAISTHDRGFSTKIATFCSCSKF